MTQSAGAFERRGDEDISLAGVDVDEFAAAVDALIGQAQVAEQVEE